MSSWSYISAILVGTIIGNGLGWGIRGLYRAAKRRRETGQQHYCYPDWYASAGQVRWLCRTCDTRWDRRGAEWVRMRPPNG